MGAGNDPMMVTDPTGYVHGVEGLRVADAPSMPFVPAPNTNIPIIMCAEKITDAVLTG